MKPLPSAPLTDEDNLIWHRVSLTWPPLPWSALWMRSDQADRRDADLMFMLAKCSLAGEGRIRVRLAAGMDAIYHVPAVHAIIRKRPEHWHYKFDISYFA